MNNARRKASQAVIESLKAIPVTDIIGTIGDAKATLEEICEEEQEAYENMPEGIQYGEKGEAAQEAINNLEYADNELYELSSFLERLDEAISYLEEAQA